MKQPIKYLAVFFLSLGSLPAFAQEEEDLLGMLGEDKPEKEYVQYAFKSSRVIMSHSLELIRPGVLDFRILHRFGNINKGAYEFFGLDQATIRLGLDYGVTRNMTIGIGRGTLKKEIDGFIKYRLVHQSKGGAWAMPFSLVAVGGATMNMLKWDNDSTRKNYYSSRMGYYGQAIIGRKFSEGFSMQVSPTIVHRNLVQTINDPSDTYAVGVGGRIKLSKRLSLNVDYYYILNKNPDREMFNPLSVGFDIETGGHVFQLHFTNAIGMNERAFLTETTNNWAKGDIQFGFNISRSFQVKKKKS